MKILGLQKLTLLDYPGRVACTVFLDRCNFLCPFCHNSHLLSGDIAPVMEREEFFSFLEKRKGILDGVCVTGGEPTIHPQLPEFLRTIRNIGYQIKLDTNGYRPDVLQSLVEEELVDYVAMDVKNDPVNYGSTVGMENLDRTKIEESIRFLLEGRVDYELRTTVVEPLHTKESMLGLCHWLCCLGGERKVRRLFLQPFVDRETVPASNLSAPNQDTLESFLTILRPCAHQVELRGI